MTANITPEWSQIIADAIDDRLIDVHTSIPGVVQRVVSKNTVDVEVQVNRMVPGDAEFISETIGVIQNVRVGMPGAGGYFSSFPLEPGATGVLFFSEAHFGQWRATGKVSDPDDVGRHTLSSPVFMPCYLKDADMSFTTSIDDGAAFGKLDGAQVRAKGDAIEVTSDGAGSADSEVALAETIDKYFTVVDGVLKTLDASILAGAYAGAMGLAFPDSGGQLPIQGTGAKNLKADKKGVV